MCGNYIITFKKCQNQKFYSFYSISKVILVNIFFPGEFYKTGHFDQ